jgi:chromatin segregation and condensation protein Rec8/ScpA/Scc1 (kleisin family)
MRLQPRRRVTLNELIGALEEAMKLKEYKEQAAAAPAAVPIRLEHTDIEAEIESVFSLVKAHADSSRMVTYSTLCEVANKENSLVSVFVPLLFLASKAKVLLIQETFFGDIVVVLN